MGSAMLKGWLERGINVDVVSRSPTSDKRAISQGAEIVKADSIIKTPDKWDAIIYAVKPKDAKNTIQQYRWLSANTIHISVMAGITINFIENLLGGASFTRIVVRTMPNTPCLIGKGVMVSFGNSQLEESNRLAVDGLMSVCGESLWVENEDLMDLVTAISGSGPAYIFYYIEEMIRIGVELGLDPKLSHDLALGVVSGAAEMAKVMDEKGQNVQALRENVTSKGGTTEAALEELTKPDGLGQILKKAVVKARDRASEIGKGQK